MNVCIVDDDQYVVDKIEQGLDWKSLGITQVLTANNIRQAMAILETNEVDLLLSDIEMPQGSGLELLEWIREQGIQTECVYISSYAHFAYAQKALQLDSKGYLLKPISNIELKKVLIPILDTIRSEKGKGAPYSEKEVKWTDILFDNQQMNESDMDKRWMFFIAVYRESIKSLTSQRLARQSFLGKVMLEEAMKRRQIPYECILRKREYEWVGVMPAMTSENWIQQWSAIKEDLSDKLEGEWSLYVSDSCDGRGIKQTRQKLLDMYEHGVLDLNGVIQGKDWHGEEQANNKPPMEIWEKELILKENTGQLHESIMEYLVREYAVGNVSKSSYRQFRHRFQQMVYHYLENRHMTIAQLFEPKELDDYYEQAIESLKKMQDYVTVVMKKIEASKAVDEGHYNVIEELLAYIKAHPEEDLSRKKLASIAFISEDYLSKKFIEETGMSIPGYVASIRMKKAKEYFLNTNLSISEVAILVGYTNFSYFSKVFREHVGTTPNQFRRIHKKEE